LQLQFVINNLIFLAKVHYRYSVCSNSAGPPEARGPGQLPLLPLGKSGAGWRKLIKLMLAWSLVFACGLNDDI